MLAACAHRRSEVSVPPLTGTGASEELTGTVALEKVRFWRATLVFRLCTRRLSLFGSPAHGRLVLLPPDHLGQMRRVGAAVDGRRWVGF